MIIQPQNFAFGKNWKRYLKKGFNDTSLQISKQYIKSFLKITDLNSKSFIDIGCGSGVHSLAAIELGAKVVSLDMDIDSVECCRELSKNHHSENWQIFQGSILDYELMGRLGEFDIVYCWGVAHHTGKMYQALDNLGKLVKKGGLLYVAIYNKVPGRRGSKMWLFIKKVYNSSNFLLQKIMELIYMTVMFLNILVRFKNPFSEIRNYQQKRGMAWSTDLIDWLGGYPYEYASVEEIFRFYQDRGFVLENIKTTNYIGCNQFLFRKK